MKRDVSQLFISPESAVRDAIGTIDRSGRISLALVVDEKKRLLNTVTDGDVRRGLMHGAGLSDPVSRLLEIKKSTPYPEPITAPEGLDLMALFEVMQQRNIRQLPIVNKRGEVVDMVIWADFQRGAPAGFQAVVMAGGLGTRLHPLTENTPKPMLPVGGRPVMELIVDQLRDAGVRQIHVSTRFQAEKIRQHFGRGDRFGVEIDYVNEDLPLGTGGALGLLKKPDEPLLVINGDIVTNVDFKAMLAFHQDQGAIMTVAVRRYEMQVPYGVADCEGPRVLGLREKPEFSFFVNAGIYLLEPSAFGYIRGGEPMNMTDLIQRLIDRGEPVVSFPISEYWLDMGRLADYERAQEDARKGLLAPARSSE